MPPFFIDAKPVIPPLPPHPHISVVRFSALGDVVMVAAAIASLRLALPGATITWITTPLAHEMLQGMEGVQFEVAEKPRSLGDYRRFYRRFRHRKFDVVLAMQANLRINLLYPALHAPIKIGFDRTRAREGQWLFCNQHIPFRNAHLVDSFLSFVEILTGQPGAPVWGLPLTTANREWARNALEGLPRPVVAIHPHASKAERNWLPERYEEIITHATARCGGSIVLTGGTAPAELALCKQLSRIAPARTRNLCGTTTPKQLAALLAQVDALIAPDTGAVHIARSLGTPVIGLYAVASPALTGPYQQTGYCVDRYPDAVRQFLNKEPASLPWNTRVHHAGAMALIEVPDVLQQLDRALGAVA